MFALLLHDIGMVGAGLDAGLAMDAEYLMSGRCTIGRCFTGRLNLRMDTTVYVCEAGCMRIHPKLISLLGASGRDHKEILLHI